MGIRTALLAFACLAAFTVRAHHGSQIAAGSQANGEAPQVVASPAPKERAAQLFFTDRRLLTQHGAEVSFYSDVLKDKVVLINFIFTHCPDACPVQSAKLAEVQRLLAGIAGERLRLVSISVDPQRDRPHVLAEYAAHFGAGPHWTFLTGAKADIDAVVSRLGQLAPNPLSHTTLFIAGDARAGRWIKLHPDAAPATIAGHLRELIAGTP